MLEAIFGNGGRGRERDGGSGIVIRGHHLNYCLRVYELQKQHEAVHLGGAPEIIVAEGIVRAIIHTGDVIYRKDVLGNNDSNKDQFIRSVAHQLVSVLVSPASTPVMITERPDPICHACAIGEHCKKNKEDRVYIYSAEAKMRKHAASIITPDNLKRRRSELHTTVGILKKTFDGMLETGQSF